MAGGTFFTSWELWQEMTFVLAMGIVIVFFVGVIKLQLANRHMRKLEELDAEKQARISQMRKSGIPASSKIKAGSEIPFGAKALESGVEVEGIWIARMASMASRPPDRKWSSRRKIRVSSASAMERGELSSPSKRSARGSRRSGKISRREIVEPSAVTREKLENLSLLEEEGQSRDLGPKDRSAVEAADEGQGRGRTNQDRTTQPGHKGALGRIQRSLRKMTPSDTRERQEETGRLGNGRLEASEFHEKARAKKPQRFYPQSQSAPIATAAEPQPRSEAGSPRGTEPRQDVETRGPPRAAPVRRFQDMRRHGSPDSNSSDDSFVTTSEVPTTASRQPSQRARRSVDHDPSTGDRASSGSRRSSGISPAPVPRRSSSLGRTGNASKAQPLAAAASTHRYPPNSSRSGAASHARSQSHTQQQQQPQDVQQQQQQQQQHQNSSSTGPVESYANTSKRKINAGFELLPAGTFGSSEEAGEPASGATGSKRSSLESQGSSGRRKLQKKNSRGQRK